MKKWLSVILALTLIMATLAGCGAAPMENSSGDKLMGGVGGDGALNDEYVAESGSGTTSSTVQPAEGQKMVYKVWLETETEDLDPLIANITQQISDLKGYMESHNQRNGSKYSGSRRYRYADMTIRIPTEKLDGFVSQIAENSNVVSKKQTAENITLSYVATQSRITALETEQTRLLELLAKANSMSDILEIEKRLTEVRGDLEEHTSQLRVYDNIVDYATIYLTISEVTEYTDVEEPETMWQRIGKGFMNSLKNLGTFFVELFVFIIVALPYLIPMGLVAAGIIWLVKRNKKKKSKE